MLNQYPKHTSIIERSDLAKLRNSVLTLKTILLFALYVGCLFFASQSSRGDIASAPVHSIGEQIDVRRWLVLGPFPKTEAKDYLTLLGGETNAVLTPATELSYENESGRQIVAAENVAANSSGMADLNDHFKLPGNKMAYAFCWLRSASNQTAQCFLGSGDGVKLWLNGRHVFEKAGSFFEQSCIPRQHQFPLTLQQGDNRLLVKTENNSGDWGFILEVAPADAAEQIVAEMERLKQIHEFQEDELQPESFVFLPGSFPQLKWRNAALVENVWGKVELIIRWFDGAWREVNQARKPGRYAAYIEAALPNGQKLRRALTLFCIEPGCEIWRDPSALMGNWISNRLIGETIWREHEEERRQAATAGLGNRAVAEREAAVVLAGLSEVKPLGHSPTSLETAAILDEDFHLALKRKLFYLCESTPLRPPRRKAGPPAPVLRKGAPQEAGMDANTASRLREVCREWADGGEQPFVALVARHGVIVFHEAFGSSNQPVEINRRFPLDSITKVLTGLMFAQFADQGLMSIDDPIGKYLRDFPIRGSKVVKLRHCLTHCTGLEGHGAWAGMRNPWLENVAANGLEYLEPGRRVIYNGTGFDLVGRAMEMVASKNIFRLMHENFLDPLGAPEVRLTDLGFTAECSAEDLARIGQLMLNHGSYGELELFCPEVFQQMQPRKASDVYPELPVTDWEYGWGVAWMRDVDPDAPGKTILSRNTIGHGSLSSTVLRVDLDNDLVIAIPRAGSGKDNGKYLMRFLQIIRESLR